MNKNEFYEKHAKNNKILTIFYNYEDFLVFIEYANKFGYRLASGNSYKKEIWTNNLYVRVQAGTIAATRYKNREDKFVYFQYTTLTHEEKFWGEVNKN